MPRAQAIALTLTVSLAACSTPMTTREKGAVAGVAIGAGTGAIIGSATGHTAGGALIGGAIGGVSGAVIGDAIQSKEQTAPPAVQSAPPPPPVVIKEPRYIWVPAWGVYVVEDYDIVYYDGHFYYFHGGYWYHARHYSGPWVFIQVVSLPPSIRQLPPGHFKTHIPPGQAKKLGRGHVPPGLRR